ASGAGSTTYTVTGTDGNGCQNTANVDVIVSALPSVGAGANQIVCEGDLITLSGSGASSYSWSGGVADGTPFTATGSGSTTYTVTGTDGAGCVNTDDVDVMVNALPLIDTEVPADATTCIATDGAITITVSGGSGTYTYSIDGGVTYLSNGGIFTGLSVGSYQVMENDGNCPVTGSLLAISGPGVPAPPTAGTTATYCDGETIFDLTATGGPGTLNWYSDAGLITTIGTGGVISPGTGIGTTPYYVAETVSGCEGPYSVVNVTINPLPTVGAGIDQTVCLGDTVTLLGSGATSYSWDNSVTDGVSFSTIAVGTTTYTVIGTDANGCVNLDDVDVVVIALPDATVLNGGQTLTAATGLTYEWVDCDNSFAAIGGETNQSFTPTITGNYAVIVSNGACSDTSVCEYVVVIGIEPVVEYQLSIYPNPSSGWFNIEFGSNDMVDQIRVVDATGKLVKLISVNHRSAISIDISNEATGLYFLTIIGNHGSKNVRLIKK
ncbi:MAG: T9SS type A sorting domain-containing protein, partial [Flavobacteriales bacterium]|nr:T9SS type A sorting domain-containing protein [Flavobacteriales bacterium]